MSDEEKNIKEQNDMEAIKEIEMQLHEQFASNYNNGFSATITLFCTLLAVLYGYGYIFLHSNLDFTIGLKDLCTDGKYALDALIFAGIAATIVLFIMKYICAYQGISQRLEQFVVYAIRTKYYGESPVGLNPRIYPSNYHPFKDGGKVLPIGLYGKFIDILCGFQCLVVVSMVIKITCSLFGDGQKQFQYCTCSLKILAFFVIFVICYGLYTDGKQELVSKYYKRYGEYLEYKKSISK